MTPFSRSKQHSRLIKGALVGLALAVLAPVGATSVDARAGGGFSFGSRGGRTFSAPPTTMTAPRPAAPFQRTETPQFGGQGAAAGAGFAQPRRFGFGSGLAAGLLGAGVLGMLTGHGFFGGLGGLFSMLGLLFQFALIGGLIWLALNYFRNRRAPSFAGRPGPTLRSAFDGLRAGSGGGSGSGPGPSRTVSVSQQDFAAFERTLSDVQHAYSREDFNALSRLTTPEMLRHLGSDIEENKRRGLRNDLSDVRLLQGDLAEAWGEGASDYATVAMRFAARDVMLDRTTGRVASGDASQSAEATELWTFRRERGGPWLVSAIQQTG